MNHDIVRPLDPCRKAVELPDGIADRKSLDKCHHGNAGRRKLWPHQDGECNRAFRRRHPVASAPSLPGGLLIRDHNRPVRSLLLAELLRILVGGVNCRKVIELLSHPLRPEPGRNLLRRDRIRTACDAVPLVRNRFYDISILPERLDRFPDSRPGNSKFFTERLAGYIVILISQRPEHLFLHSEGYRAIFQSHTHRLLSY